jgi:diphthine methyl ester synthase
MLYLIGTGLGDEKDITVKGLEAVKSCSYIYLESYTNALSVPKDKLEEFYGKEIILADREMIEKNSDEILEKAEKSDVALLIIGDVFAATTHVDFMLRAKEKKVDIEVINNASVLTAVGEVGLELYKYGKVTSIPFENENIDTPVNVLKDNQSLGLHTLFLLDLDPKNDKFLSFGSAAKYLISKGVGEDVVAIGCATLGTKDKEIKVLKLKEMIEINKYPQCLIIPGKLHFVEEEALEIWK